MTPTGISKIGLCIGFLLIAVPATAQQAQDLIRAGSRWQGEILQGNQRFPTTILVTERTGERIRGEVHFSVGSRLNKLTFQGNVIDNSTVIWITDKKEGNVTYPGLYLGKVNGNQISGIWQVPSAGQYDRFVVTLVR